MACDAGHVALAATLARWLPLDAAWPRKTWRSPPSARSTSGTSCTSPKRARCAAASHLPSHPTTHPPRRHQRRRYPPTRALQTKRIESDAVEAVQACSSEFLSFIASEARLKVRREGRSEVNEGDMLWALQALGFKSFGDALRGHLNQQYTVRGAGGQPKAPPGASGAKPAKRPRPIGTPKCNANPDPHPNPHPSPDPNPDPTPNPSPNP